MHKLFGGFGLVDSNFTNDSSNYNLLIYKPGELHKETRDMEYKHTHN